MLDWATAAFMKRKSRMAEVMATVPTAAHAARRMKSRRVMTEMFFLFMSLFLDNVVGRIGDQMNDGTNTVAHLGLAGGRAIGEIVGAGNIGDDIGLGGVG